VLSSLEGGAKSDFLLRNGKGRPRLSIRVYYSNHMSIMHSLRSNQVLPLTENDVIVLPPFEGATSDFWYTFGKGNPDDILVFNSNNNIIIMYAPEKYEVIIHNTFSKTYYRHCMSID
jgi:hypothetical protein